jgi:hypothetical protein
MPAKKKADHRLQGQKSPLRPTRRTISLANRQVVIISLLMFLFVCTPSIYFENID